MLMLIFAIICSVFALVCAALAALSAVHRYGFSLMVSACSTIICTLSALFYFHRAGLL